MTYDPAYDTTVAVVIPVAFVAIAVDLGLTGRARTATEASSVLSVVVLLLCSELLTLSAIAHRHEMASLGRFVVTVTLVLSGVLAYVGVARTLESKIRQSPLAGALHTALACEAIMLVVFCTNGVLGATTAVVIFALTIIAVVWVVPRLVAISQSGFEVPSKRQTRSDD